MFGVIGVGAAAISGYGCWSGVWAAAVSVSNLFLYNAMDEFHAELCDLCHCVYTVRNAIIRNIGLVGLREIVSTRGAVDAIVMALNFEYKCIALEVWSRLLPNVIVLFGPILKTCVHDMDREAHVILCVLTADSRLQVLDILSVICHYLANNESSDMGTNSRDVGDIAAWQVTWYSPLLSCDMIYLDAYVYHMIYLFTFVF